MLPSGGRNDRLNGGEIDQKYRPFLNPITSPGVAKRSWAMPMTMRASLAIGAASPSR
jgi:hypothetical protein